MITCRIYRDGILDEEKPFDPGAVEAALSTGGYAWLDAVEPTDDELRRLQHTFELHPLSVEDSSRWGQRSKVELYPDYVFLVAHGLRLDDDDRLIDSEVHLFARKDSHLITVRRKPLIDFPSVAQRAKGEHGMPEEGIGVLLYLLLDEIVDGYLDAIDRLEDLGDDIEERAGGADPDRAASDDMAADIFRVRQLVVRFRRLAVPMREVVDLLMDAPGIVTEALAPYYRDVLDHVIRVSELSDNVRDLMTSARELQLAQVSNRLNVVMKQLTAWAAIILIPTLIAGIYGMNFEHMPELSWRLGYPLALGMMAGAAFLLYLVFRKRDWL